jgi:chaperonin cofactor prefoldin
MPNYEILPFERDENKKAMNVSMIYKDIRITFTPNYEDKTFAFIKTNLFGRRNTSIPPDIFNAMINQIRGIFFSKGKKKIIHTIPIPNKERLIEEAMILHAEILALKENHPRLDLTNLSEKVLKSEARKTSLLTHKDFRYMNVFKANWLFDLGKLGIKVSPEGWIVLHKKKDVVFDFKAAVRMQDNILKKYLDKTSKDCGEIPKIEETRILIKEINNLLLDWDNTKKKKKNLQTKITTLINDLSSCRDKLKKDTAKLGKSILPLKDSLDRNNPGAFAAKTIAMLNNLGNRLIHIKEVLTPLVTKRKNSLNNCYSEMNTKKLEAIKDLDKFISMRGFSNFPESFKIGTINKLLYSMEGLFISSFHNKSVQTSFYLNAAKDCILETKKAKKILRTALSILQS